MPIVPTLRTMGEIYALPRTGGQKSARFTAYLAHAGHGLGFSGFNPMAGPAALESVRALIALDAERIARDAELEIRARCDFEGELTLAVVLASPGMWTDRLASEVRHRTDEERREGFGTIVLWAGDPSDAELVRRETVAEAVRVMWTSLHGAAETLGATLAREGLAYALATSPHALATNADRDTVTDAFAVLGDTNTLADIVAVLYGDPAAIALGWNPLGVAEYAGYRWAIARAANLVAAVGPAAALRELALAK